MPTITAIHSGGDWTDASAEYVVLAEGMNIQAEYEAYQSWYRDEYCPLRQTPSRIEWKSFVTWLIERGARYPADDELEIFDEEP